jgi:hypothetical protein
MALLAEKGWLFPVVSNLYFLDTPPPSVYFMTRQRALTIFSLVETRE